MKLSIIKTVTSYNIWLYNIFFKGGYLKDNVSLNLIWNNLNKHFLISYIGNDNLTSSTDINNYNTALFYSMVKFLTKNSLCQFNTLIDIIGLPLNTNSPTATNDLVVYNFLSLIFNYRISVVFSKKYNKPYVSFFTLCNIFYNAAWYEREIFDLFGYIPENNNDLSRILTDYGFLLHPLQKNYPSVGFVETVYNDSTNRILYTKVELSQAYRNFKTGRIKKSYEKI